jgi:hypothetical protein
MIDAFDIIAFIVFAVLMAAALIIVVLLGSLPGNIARKRGHPQAAAVTVASWLGLATGGLLWPLALIWAFWKPSAPVGTGATLCQAPRPISGPEANAPPDALETTLRRVQVGREDCS